MLVAVWMMFVAEWLYVCKGLNPRSNVCGQVIFKIISESIYVYRNMKGFFFVFRSVEKTKGPCENFVMRESLFENLHVDPLSLYIYTSQKF